MSAVLPPPTGPPPPPPPAELSVIVDVGSVPYALRGRKYVGEELLREHYPSVKGAGMSLHDFLSHKLRASSLIKQMARIFRL